MHVFGWCLYSVVTYKYQILHHLVQMLKRCLKCTVKKKIITYNVTCHMLPVPDLPDPVLCLCYLATFVSIKCYLLDSFYTYV